jgi:polar amino acid transport system substrate-binding protein
MKRTLNIKSRRRRNRIAGSLVALCTAAALAGCGADAGPRTVSTAPLKTDPVLHRELPPGVRASGVLRVATDASYAPAESFAPDGRTIVGFEPDLGVALGQVLGVKVRFVNVDFSKVLTAVAKHRFDLAMSAITDTTAREHLVDFVNYFTAGTSIVVQRGNPTGITDLAGLCGHAVAVESDTTQVDLLARAQSQCHGDRMRVKTYPTNDDALLQLRTGRASAVLNDYPPAAYLAASRSRSTSRMGGCPNSRLYSRLNCEASS